MGRYALAAYLALLAASHLVRSLHPTPRRPAPDESAVVVGEVGSAGGARRAVRVAFHDWPAADSGAPVLLLIHGSPGAGGVFDGLGPLLAGKFRVLAPDLPGFGGSTARIPDYSIRAHARYLLELLDSLGVQRVHLVGFSMGGGVALEMAAIAPERVHSLTLLSSIGVQEMELLGEYHLNHLIHGIQLAGLWFLREGTPQFGYLDDAFLSVEYARNFYDSDQRPLRGILERYAGPALIIHGDHDPLVPPAAAREHYRLLPQAELVMLQGDHFMTFQRPELLAGPIEAFVQRVESGRVATRATATPDRLARAALPYDPASAPRPAGVALMVTLLLIAAATLVSEDLTCITTGLLVARGSIGFVPGTIACLMGIFVGDLGLFFTGRVLGRRVLRWPPLKWLVRQDDVDAACDWFRRRGPALVLASRFVPGTRLPTYVAAGILHTGVWSFSFWFLLAALLWTPLLVGVSAVFGIPVRPLLARYRGEAWIAIAVAGLLLYLMLKLMVPLFTFQGRRLLLSRWRRLTRWEFWPPWVFYPPVVLYVVYLGIKHRGLTLFTAVNPAIPGGGFVGESKSAILSGLLEGQADSPVARFEVIPARHSVPERLTKVGEFLRRHGLALPVVLKPDAGERGSGVAVIRSHVELEAYLNEAGCDTMVQEYVPGEEFGVFYYRLPGEDKGRIFSITRKRLPRVTGDGVSTLRELILNDARAVCLAPLFLRRHARRLLDVPAAGEVVSLGDVGNHCRGAEFFDGIAVMTPELEGAIDRLSRRYEGFSFGRYDIRTPSVADLREGRNFTVLELNGATSEATHIYDPAHGLFRAYATLFEQWRILFRIAAHNRASGVRPLSLGELLTSLREHRRKVSLHPSG